MKRIIAFSLVGIILCMSLFALCSCGAKEMDEFNGEDAEEALETAIDELMEAYDNGKCKFKSGRNEVTAKLFGFITLDSTKTNEDAYITVSALANILSEDEGDVKYCEDGDKRYFKVSNEAITDSIINSEIYSVYLNEDDLIESITRIIEGTESVAKIESSITHTFEYN